MAQQHMILRLLLFAARCLSWVALISFFWVAFRAAAMWAGAFMAGGR